MILFGQGWSNYYIDANINQNINKNVNVRGYVNQTIRTIDYGALANANAKREKTRLEKQIYDNDQDRIRTLDIANNPVKAFDYGQRTNLKINTSKLNDYKHTNFKKFTISYMVPHSSLFVFAGQGRLENVSEDGIITEIIFSPPWYNKYNHKIVSHKEYQEWKNSEIEKEKVKIRMPKKRDYKTSFEYNRALQQFNRDKNKNIFPILNMEDQAKMHDLKVGGLNVLDNITGDEIFVHKKDVNRATVYGVKGFKGTFISEDNYQYMITDNYNSWDLKGNGIYYFVKVSTYGDKDEVTFEQLEGRRYYLKRLVERIISTASVTDIKY